MDNTVSSVKLFETRETQPVKTLSHLVMLLDTFLPCLANKAESDVPPQPCRPPRIILPGYTKWPTLCLLEVLGTTQRACLAPFWPWSDAPVDKTYFTSRQLNISFHRVLLLLPDKRASLSENRTQNAFLCEIVDRGRLREICVFVNLIHNLCNRSLNCSFWNPTVIMEQNYYVMYFVIYMNTYKCWWYALVHS